MAKIKRTSLPIFWDLGNIKNSQTLREKLEDGWRINRVDELRDENRPVLMYILEKDVYDEY